MLNELLQVAFIKSWYTSDILAVRQFVLPIIVASVLNTIFYFFLEKYLIHINLDIYNKFCIEKCNLLLETFPTFSDKDLNRVVYLHAAHGL